MESDEDAEPTQQATQTVLDPRRLGKQNSGFSDEDLADIICVLIPSSEHARREVKLLRDQTSIHLVGNEDVPGVEEGLVPLDDDHDDRTLGLMHHGRGQQGLALRFSAQNKLKDPLQGFVFGRNPHRCDIPLVNDPKRRLSNTQFRIYYNQHRVLMLQDVSTNGTIVDEIHLKSSMNRTMRTLNNGSTVKMLLHLGDADLVFLVRIPRREGEYEAAYRENLARYMRRLEQLRLQHDQLHPDANATICPGPEGHVDLFPAAVNRPRRPNTTAASQENQERLARAWHGSDRYHMVGEIGKGAFATVYQVTDKWEGTPYAAKELDKRKFMKNGVLDQKVENEMTIMRKIHHPNIVRYIEHLDWDSRLLIIIMEYVPGGDLGRLIFENGSLIEEAVKTMALQLLDALGYLHGNNITHRDVKPDNILVSSRSPFVVKLTDFGLSKMVDNEQTFLRTFCGTLLYCAPEVYNEFAEYDEFGHRNPRNRQRRQARGQRYDHAVDIWSLGGVLFFAMTGKPPYPVKGGISHSELLHRVMTEELDITPLLQAGISELGVDFIRRMLNRRPEDRATVEMLMDHPWLGGTGKAFYRDTDPEESYDEISDDDLDQQASQLSLAERPSQQQQPDSQDTEILEAEEEVDDENQLGGYESEKENYTFGAADTQEPLQGGGPRLFGEVNVSAMGSEGAIPSDRLNLPVPASGTSFETTEIIGNGRGSGSGSGSGSSSGIVHVTGDWEEQEIKDSFDSDDTPRQKTYGSQALYYPESGQGLRASVLSASQSRSVEHLNNMTFNVESQDLGGTESIMEHLNMQSAGLSHLPSPSLDNRYFTSSKRKTSYEPSEGSDSSAIHYDRPALKRFRSEALADSMTDYSSDDDAAEYELLAQVPPIVQTRSTRQMDEPVNKSTYWTAGDRKSYHLRYPEMTQLQLDAFTSAAKTRGEEFGPGKSPLWDLAMKYFPPAHYEQGVRRRPLDVETVSNASNDVKTARQAGAVNEELPPTVGLENAADDDDDYIPDTLPQQPIIVPVPINPPGKRIVASLRSSPESGIRDVSIHVTEPMLSWGRALENTRIFEPKTQVKVPKYAFKIMLWRPGYDSSRDFRPWNQNTVKDEDSFHFYISTKSNHGIYINDVHLRSHEPKSPSADSRYWLRLQDGDKIVVCHWCQPSGERTGKTELIFRCAWGGSSIPREDPSLSFLSSDDNGAALAPAASIVPEHIAKELDGLCAKAERRVKANDEHDFKIAEAVIDRDERSQDIRSEKERSRVFDSKRLEARRVLAARHSRKPSPTSAPAVLPGVGVYGVGIGPGPGAAQAARTLPALRRISPGPGGL